MFTLKMHVFTMETGRMRLLARSAATNHFKQMRLRSRGKVV